MQTIHELSKELQRHPERFTFSPAPGRSEFWRTMKVVARRCQPTNAVIGVTPEILTGIVSCGVCKLVLKYDCQKTGSSHIKRHSEHCKPGPHGKKKQQLMLQFANKTLRLSESEKLDIKTAELEFCVRGYHAFHSVENDGLIKLLQQFVNMSATHGRFNVSDVIYGRKTISLYCKEKAAVIRERITEVLVEPQLAEAVAVTLDLWTDEYKHTSYLDVHVFWIDKSFEMKHQVLAVRHFGTERHTAENISRAIQTILAEYAIDASNITATTDHGANVVAAFRVGILETSARLDCMAHRLHTCFSTMWSRVCTSQSELLDYDNNASSLVKYCNQASGVQEQLPVSLKKGSSTRRWQGYIDRAYSINESYEALVRILSEPHRDRMQLIASVNRRMNAEILQFMKPFGDIFDVMQFNSKPTIGYAVLA